jgi:Uma2 family endonuclease
MIVFVPTFETTEVPFLPKPKYDSVSMSLEEFLNWSPEAEENIKYEWINGKVEAGSKMRSDEIYLYRNLQKEFSQKSDASRSSDFVCEVDVYLKPVNKLRRPDIVFLKDEEIQLAKKKGEAVIPRFIIEIVSSSNSVNEVEMKIRDYFTSGVKLVWIIFPAFEEVKVYHSIKDIKVCNGSDQCEAGSVIPGFSISVKSLFQ